MKQYNSFSPQFIYYDINNFKDRPIIHIILKFLTMHYVAPKVGRDCVLAEAHMSYNLAYPVLIGRAGVSDALQRSGSVFSRKSSSSGMSISQEVSKHVFTYDRLNHKGEITSTSV